MSKIDEAVAWAVSIAYDATHGYDQASRWGPDYDCSSLVISAWKKAGVPLTCTYTGNMLSDMLSHGFVKVEDGTRQKGDVLLNQASHTAMMINGYQLVQAGSNENGGVTGGVTGDQTGNEIRVMGYYDFPWDVVLRYVENESTTVSTQDSGTYTVKRGDTLWGIATNHGMTVAELRRLNNITGDTIYPGQVFKLNDTKVDSDGSGTDDTVSAVSGISKVTVKAGDTLWGIAAKYLGSGARYKELAEINQIKDPNSIKVGQVIELERRS